MQSNQTLHGVFMGPLLERPAVHRMVDELLEATAERRLDLVIDQLFPFREAARALEYAETESRWVAS